MNELIVSAPGKILWIGGYSVLEKGNVSLISGVNKRVYAKIKKRKDSKVKIISKQFNYFIEGKIESGKIIFDSAQKNFNKAKFVLTAVESVLEYLKKKKHKTPEGSGGDPAKGFDLDTFSDKEFGVEVKAGLGSSAAVVSAVTGALMVFFGFDLIKDLKIIHKLAQFSHSTAQGKIGSGFDVAASCLGASSYIRYSPEFVLKEKFPECIDQKWDCEVNHIDFPSSFETVIASLNKSADTKEFVKKFNSWKQEKPEEFKEFIHDYNEINKKVVDDLKLLNEDFSEENLFKFKEYFMLSRLKKKELGKKINAEIEPGEFSELIDSSLDSGAFVCILPGAGGGDSIAAFCLNKKDKGKLISFWKSINLTVLDLRISGEGLKLEQSFPS
ncbi:MAG TPA: hypothetical protein VJK05_05860 [archaeon]|nr:hypothetical protein [archaeon]